MFQNKKSVDACTKLLDLFLIRNLDSQEISKTPSPLPLMTTTITLVTPKLISPGLPRPSYFSELTILCFSLHTRTPRIYPFKGRIASIMPHYEIARCSEKCATYSANRL